MKKVMPVTFQFNYIDGADSQKRMQTAYNRIFMLAKQNILERRRLRRKTKLYNCKVYMRKIIPISYNQFA